tara:strand:- start:1782 stop:2051 length:270 start_codon:yes stop_codon:yes gene_type:complete
MVEDKWMRIMEMVFGLVNEIDEALHEVDAEPIDTLIEDDHGEPDDWIEEEEVIKGLEVLDVCLVCGTCTADLQYHLDHNIECAQALRYV